MTDQPPAKPPQADRLRDEMRSQMRQQRRQLPAQTRIHAAIGIRKGLAALPAWSAARNVAGYWACHGEVPLNLALADAEQHNQHFWLPRTLPEQKLTFARWSSGDPTVNNRYGIPEPVHDAPCIDAAKLDLVLVPLLAFDPTGNRLGMGGGYYDRSFAFLNRASRPLRPLLVGVAYSFQKQPRLDARPWDVSLDYVVTENELIHCTDARKPA